jgi:hypothetical protein
MQRTGAGMEVPYSENQSRRLSECRRAKPDRADRMPQNDGQRSATGLTFVCAGHAPPLPLLLGPLTPGYGTRRLHGPPRLEDGGRGVGRGKEVVEAVCVPAKGHRIRGYSVRQPCRGEGVGFAQADC